jgi:hypothetical protein
VIRNNGLNASLLQVIFVHKMDLGDGLAGQEGSYAMGLDVFLSYSTCVTNRCFFCRLSSEVVSVVALSASKKFQ